MPPCSAIATAPSALCPCVCAHPRLMTSDIVEVRLPLPPLSAMSANARAPSVSTRPVVSFTTRALASAEEARTPLAPISVPRSPGRSLAAPPRVVTRPRFTAVALPPPRLHALIPTATSPCVSMIPPASLVALASECSSVYATIPWAARHESLSVPAGSARTALPRVVMRPRLRAMASPRPAYEPAVTPLDPALCATITPEYPLMATADASPSPDHAAIPSAGRKSPEAK